MPQRNVTMVTYLTMMVEAQHEQQKTISVEVEDQFLTETFEQIEDWMEDPNLQISLVEMSNVEMVGSIHQKNEMMEILLMELDEALCEELRLIFLETVEQ